MYIVKKLIIMGSVGNSKVSGLLKFENFGGRTACEAKIFGADEGYLCIRCNDKLELCMPLICGKLYLGNQIDLSGNLQALVLCNDQVVCVGSSKGTTFYYGNFAAQARNAIALEREGVTTSAANASPFQISASDPVKSEREQDATLEQAASQPQASFDQQAPQAEESAPLDIADESVPAADTVSLKEEKEGNEAIPPVLPFVKESEERDYDPIQDEIADARQEKKLTVETFSVDDTDHTRSFYDRIEKQLDEVMTTYPADEELQTLIEDSRWVRVPTEERDYYVVGLLYRDGTPAVICYGVPDQDKNQPPACKAECRQWMELEKDGRGYWMMYQNASDGQILSDTVL